MVAKRARSVLVTVFGVIGIACFGILALEYVIARYDALGAIIVLPEPLGLGGFLQGVPDWAAIAMTSGIWLGLLGAVLLLLGDRASVLVLALAFVASLVALVWGVLAFLQGHTEIMEIRPLEYASALAFGSFGMWVYARTAKRSGRL
ncbi:hypothetical protein [Roseinatronobacter alkalisoli]|uniref:Uncharacterized protein n=1 Tax=Roseinatronobacter alkalisoli TaxID=3028235 RepID=A0ABT5T7V1_9RHOB|nr:hypothetical protein [Roseinatronobacter sp. HJB301]MDD7971139.1 hypothetical protein [Roseinatronobacter sp. HJB301]